MVVIDLPSCEGDVRDEIFGKGYWSNLSELEGINRCLMRHIEAFRDYLGNQGRICELACRPDFTPFYLLATDSASICEKFGGGAHLLISGVCLDLEGVISQELKTYLFPNNSHMDYFCILSRLSVEFDLINNLSLSDRAYIIFDYSFKRLPIEVNHIFYQMLAYRSSLIDTNYDKFYEEWQGLMNRVFGVNGSCLKLLKMGQALAITKENMSRFFTGEFQVFIAGRGESGDVIKYISNLNDRVLMQFILRPGEYINPRSCLLIENDRKRIVNAFRHSYHSFLDLSFLELEFSRRNIYHTYFYPKDATYVQRIEYFDGNKIEDILETVQCYSYPKVPEILQQAKADKYAKLNLMKLNNEYQDNLIKILKKSGQYQEGLFYQILLSKQRS